jgi:hypothetical protein
VAKDAIKATEQRLKKLKDDKARSDKLAAANKKLDAAKKEVASLKPRRTKKAK